MKYDEIIKTCKVYGAVKADAPYVSADADLDLDPPHIWDVQNAHPYGDEVDKALDALTPDTIRALDYQFADNWGDAGAYVATLEDGDFILTVALVIDED